MKTQDEILEKIASMKDDFFGTGRTDLVSALNWNNAKEFLKDDAKKSDFEKVRLKIDADVLKKIKDYMEFAWEKANGCRGLSASRSIDHFKAWMFLLGDDEKVDFDDWGYYGKNILVNICQLYDIDYSALDNGIRSGEEE